MRKNRQHLSDEQLLLAADDEPGKRAGRVRAHLEACDCCRTREEQLNSVLADLAQAERTRMDAGLPSIAAPRALLRSRIEDLSSTRTGFFPFWHIPGNILLGIFALTSVVCLIALAGSLAFRPAGEMEPPAPFVASERGVLPNRSFTPGSLRHASVSEVCQLPHEEVVKAVSPSERQKVFAEYKIPSAQAGQYEVDYLITPGLGGQDDIQNLWPQPYNSSPWNAYAKDALEERLHEMVCSHQLDLSVAQAAIATNWIAAYEKYVHPTPKNRA